MRQPRRFLVLLTMAFGLMPALSVSAENPPEPDKMPDLTIEQFLQQLSTVPGVLHRKDPFVKSTPPYQSILDSWRSLNGEAGRPETDLERYEIKDYRVRAVLLGDIYNRALVGVPNATGSVMIVRENDRLGNRGGVITKIDRVGVTVVQKTKSRTGVVDNTTVVLPVGDQNAAGGGR
ncbi:MAG: pilus assembly protein PilP [Bdellovibrionales bacterium]|nr:pilus assembly protein PilP [Bdellovibrionales bacterium]